ncbi:MAG: RNA polymerase sigma factor [Bacteroidia bacterium]
MDEITKLYYDKTLRTSVVKLVAKYWSASREEILSLADEVFQEAMIILQKHLEEGIYDVSKSSLKTYFLGICRYKLLEALRAIQKSTNLHISIDEHDFKEMVEVTRDENYFTEIGGKLYECMQQLSDKLQQIIHWKFFDELSVTEINERLGYGKESTQSFTETKRALISLKKCLTLKGLKNAIWE